MYIYFYDRQVANKRRQRRSRNIVFRYTTFYKLLMCKKIGSTTKQNAYYGFFYCLWNKYIKSSALLRFPWTLTTQYIFIDSQWQTLLVILDFLRKCKQNY